MRKIRVGINGFGRIGRIVFRMGYQDMEIVGINDPGKVETATHLLKYDSSHGRFKADVKTEGTSLVVDGKKIPFSAEKDPQKIPWKNWEVDLVLECTGVFKNREEYAWHLNAGAKRVLVSAPAPGADLTMVYGVNHKQYDPQKHVVLSNASCTTNCLAPVVKVLHEKFKIENGMMTTVHSYTNDQKVLDAAHKDLRRARSAAVSMIPTTTGAAKAVGEVLPELKGKIDGISIRVPTPNVSVVDFTFRSQEALTIASINQSLIDASKGFLKGVLEVESEQLVSSDFNGQKASSIVDLPSTMIVGPNMGKVLAWYDNEAGFSSRMVDVVNYIDSVGY